jgi:hypothetical protein
MAVCQGIYNSAYPFGSRNVNGLICAGREQQKGMMKDFRQNAPVSAQFSNIIGAFCVGTI